MFNPWCIVPLAFGAGGALGFFIGSKIGLKEFDVAIKKANDERDEARQQVAKNKRKIEELINKYDKEAKDSVKHSRNEKKKPDIMDLAKKIHENGYSPEEDEPDPFVNDHGITECDFNQYTGSTNDENSTTLTFYTIDKVLTDERDEVLENPKAIIGERIYKQLTEDQYGDLPNNDAIYIYNSLREMYYEVLIERDLSYYADIRIEPEEDDYE